MHKLFPSQLENEQVYLVVREHWVRLVLKLILWAFFAAAIPVFNYYASTYTPGLFEGEAGKVVTIFTIVYEMFLLVTLLLLWLHYYLNIQIITNLRVVDIDQVGLFSHTISELHIENIEDVTSETTGVLGTVFSYGNVFVQTAGTKERFEFNNVPHPANIEKMILDLYEKAPKKHHD